MKFTSQKHNDFEANNSGAVNTLTVWCKHHLCLIPEHSYVPPPKEIPYPSKGSGICHLGIGSWEFGMSPGPRIGIFGVWNSLSCRHMTPAGAGETFSRNLPASSSPKRELIVSNVLMGYHQLGRWTLVTAEDMGVNPTGRHSHESYKRDHTRGGF